MGACSSVDEAYVRLDARKPKRSSWLLEAQPVQPTGVSVYVRVGGLPHGSSVSAAAAPVRLLREGLVCVLAELAEADVSAVKGLNGQQAMLTLLACQEPPGLVFGGFLSAADLATHSGGSRAIEDVRNTLLSDAARVRLAESAKMPIHLISSESSVILEVYAVEGVPDPPDDPGEKCPWDLHQSSLSVPTPSAVAKPSKTEPAKTAGMLEVKEMTELSDIVTSEFHLNHHESLNIVEDHPDSLIQHQGVGSACLDSMVRIEASCSLLETSHCCSQDSHKAPACKPPQRCFPCDRGVGGVEETADEMFISASLWQDSVQPCFADEARFPRTIDLAPMSTRSTSASGLATQRSSECVILSRTF